MWQGNSSRKCKVNKLDNLISANPLRDKQEYILFGQSNIDPIVDSILKYSGEYQCIQCITIQYQCRKNTHMCIYIYVCVCVCVCVCALSIKLLCWLGTK